MEIRGKVYIIKRTDKSVGRMRFWTGKGWEDTVDKAKKYNKLHTVKRAISIMENGAGFEMGLVYVSQDYWEG